MTILLSGACRQGQACRFCGDCTGCNPCPENPAATPTSTPMTITPTDSIGPSEADDNGECGRCRENLNNADIAALASLEQDVICDPSCLMGDTLNCNIFGLVSEIPSGLHLSQQPPPANRSLLYHPKALWCMYTSPRFVQYIVSHSLLKNSNETHWRVFEVFERIIPFI